MTLDKKLVLIKKKIKFAQKKSEYKKTIKIIAVTKTHPFSVIEKSYKSSILSIGENKIQEAEKKFKSFKKMPKLEKRFIGHLQSNKVNKCVKIFDTIDTIDSLKLAKKISKSAFNINKKIIGLIEINTSKEPQKNGFLENQIEEVFSCLRLSNLDIVGLMTMGPNTKNTTQIRSSFKKLKKIRDKINLKEKNKKITELSMGMSSDYEIGVEEGATMIRLGTVLFGHRGVL